MAQSPRATRKKENHGPDEYLQPCKLVCSTLFLFHSVSQGTSQSFTEFFFYTVQLHIPLPLRTNSTFKVPIFISQMLRPHGLASAPQLPKLDPFFISLTLHSIFLSVFIGKSTLEGCLCRCWKGLCTAQLRA